MNYTYLISGLILCLVGFGLLRKEWNAFISDVKSQDSFMLSLIRVIREFLLGLSFGILFIIVGFAFVKGAFKN